MEIYNLCNMFAECKEHGHFYGHLMGKRLEKALSQLPLDEQQKANLKSVGGNRFLFFRNHNIEDSVKYVLTLLVAGNREEKENALSVLRSLFLKGPALSDSSMDFFSEMPQLLIDEIRRYKEIIDYSQTDKWKTYKKLILDKFYNLESPGPRKRITRTRPLKVNVTFAFKDAPGALEAINHVLDMKIPGLNSLTDVRTSNNMAISIFCYRRGFDFEPVRKIYMKNNRLSEAARTEPEVQRKRKDVFSDSVSSIVSKNPLK